MNEGEICTWSRRWRPTVNWRSAAGTSSPTSRRLPEPRPSSSLRWVCLRCLKACVGLLLRMAKAYAEMLSPRSFDLTTFPNDEAYDELLVARALPVESVCEHHMLPFTGVAHVGYIPDSRILGLSKFARVVEMFARRPQTQERLTRQIADWLDTRLSPRGIGVVIEATHTCMSIRGVRATGSTTVTSAVEGLLREDARTRSEFLAIAHGRTS